MNNEYESPELRENPPLVPDPSKIVRNILADKPRVTTFPIDWSNNTGTEGGDPSRGDFIPPDILNATIPTIGIEASILGANPGGIGGGPGSSSSASATSGVPSSGASAAAIGASSSSALTPGANQEEDLIDEDDEDEDDEEDDAL